MVDKIMTDSDDANKLEGSDCCKKICKFGRILHINRVCRNSQSDKKECQ